MSMVQFNAQRLAKGFVIRKAKRGVQSLAERIGPQNCAKLIDGNISLATALDSIKDPELKTQLASWKDRAKGYAWAARLITDEDFVNMLPPWLLQLIAARGESGGEWLKGEIVWLRGLFTG